MKDNMELDIGQLFHILKKKARFIFLITVVFALVGLLVCEVFTQPVYEAQMKMIVNASGSSGQNINSDQWASSMKLVDTCAVIICSQNVLQPIIDGLGLKDTCESLAKRISVESVNGTPIMKVTVRYSDPDMAKAITAKILEIAPEQIVESIEAGFVKKVEDVTGSDEPIATSLTKTVALYAAVGFALSCALFVALAMLDNTFQTEKDVTQMLNLPVLGVIPSVESCKKVSNTQEGRNG